MSIVTEQGALPQTGDDRPPLPTRPMPHETGGRQPQPEEGRPHPQTVLERVFQRDGALCRCEGGCGVEHSGRVCAAEASHRMELLVAPYPLPFTEHETAAAPLESLRPWCVPCWRKARRRMQELAAELRRQELAESQIALPLDLFGGAA